jgi:hypothetical protein
LTDRNGSIANAALVNIGKAIGMFNEKTEGSETDSVTAPIKSMINEEAAEPVASYLGPRPPPIH